MGPGLGGSKKTVGNIKRAESNKLVEIDLEHIFLKNYQYRIRIICQNELLKPETHLI